MTSDAFHESYSYSNSQDDLELKEIQHQYEDRIQPEGATIVRPLRSSYSVGFQGYIVETYKPFAGFHHIIIAYCLVAFVLVYPFVVCGRHLRDNRKRRLYQEGKELAEATAAKEATTTMMNKEQPYDGGADSGGGADPSIGGGGGGVVSPPPSDLAKSLSVCQEGGTTSGSSSGEDTHPVQDQDSMNHSINKPSSPVGFSVHGPVIPAPESTTGSVPEWQLEGIVPTKALTVTPTTTKSTFQEDPDNKPLSNIVPVPPPASVGFTTNHMSYAQKQQLQQLGQAQQHQHPMQSRQQHSQVASSSGILSRNPSAATTGRLYSAATSSRLRPSRRTPAAWPRHKHSRRPSGDPSWQWRRAIQNERRHRNRLLEELNRNSQFSQQQQQQQPQSANNTATDANNSNMLFRLKNSAAGMMSDLANSVLSAEQLQQPSPYNSSKAQPPSKQQQQGPHYQSSSSDAALYSRRAMAVRQRQIPIHVQQQQQTHAQYQQQHQGRSMFQRRPSHSGSARSGRSGGSMSLRSQINGYPASIMSSIVDDISPNDAADADDPGKVRAFPTSGGMIGPDGVAGTTPCWTACLLAMEPWLDVAEPNEEWKRLMGLAIPTTAGAILEPLSRCILVGIISQYVGTHAAVAFLLVQLLYKLTGQILSVAITDAESTLVQMALTASAANNQQQDGNANGGGNNSPSFTREGYRLAGQYVQLSCWLQLVLVGTVLVLLHFYMEDAILWWVNSTEIASLAKAYYEIVMYIFFVQAIYRALMVPCHLRGSEHSTLETIMDVFVTTATLITAAVVLAKTADIPSEYEQQVSEPYTPKDRLSDSRTALITVAWIQVNIGVAACVLKVAFVTIKGWIDHFWGGLLRSFAPLVRLLSSHSAFCGSLFQECDPDILLSSLSFTRILERCAISF